MYSVLIWGAQFGTNYSPLSFLNSKEERFRAQLFLSADAWKDYFSGFGSESGARRKADLAFTLLTALLLNAFTLLGALERPILFLVLYAVLLVALLVVWTRQLGKWQNEALVLTGAWREGVYPAIAALGGFALFLWNGALVSSNHQSWLIDIVDKGKQLGPYPVIVNQTEVSDLLKWERITPKNKVDLRIFLGQMASVAATTAVPFMTYWLFKRPIKRRLTATGFELLQRNRSILIVDQAAGRVRSGGVKAPLLCKSISLEILDGGDSPVTWRVVWKRSRKVGLEYWYSVFTIGRYFYIVDLDGCCLMRRLVLLVERAKARKPGWGECPYEVVSSWQIGKTDQSINLGAHRIAPSIPPQLIERTTRCT